MAELHTDQDVDRIGARMRQVHARIQAAARRAERDPGAITLIAVTKTVPVTRIAAALLAGIGDLGENRVQEAATKRPLPAGSPAVRWHLIGRLQRNKVRQAASLFDVIHSIDSVELARRLGQCCEERGSVIEAFAQVNVSGEATKAGFSPEDFRDQAAMLAAVPRIRWRGLMTIAPQGADPGALHHVFHRTAQLHAALAALFDPVWWTALSMGMSEDFEIAIEEGATHVRLGRALFGDREERLQG
jgi:pyridoxal phosphate enzyme (YggS family)